MTTTKKQTALTLIPLEDRIVVRPIKEQETRSQSGLYLAPTQVEGSPQGIVLAVGEGKTELINGEYKIRPLKLEEGDRIAYPKTLGAIVDVEGQEVVVIKECDVLRVIE